MTDTDTQMLADRIARAVRREKCAFPAASQETINVLLDAAARITALEARLASEQVQQIGEKE